MASGPCCEGRVLPFTALFTRTSRRACRLPVARSKRPNSAPLPVIRGSLTPRMTLCFIIQTPLIRWT